MGPPRAGRGAPQEGGLHGERGELAARGGGERGHGVEGGDGLVQLRGDATALQRVEVRAREREEVRVVRVGAHGWYGFWHAHNLVNQQMGNTCCCC